MKSKLLTLLLSSTILISCGKKNGSAPSRIDQSQLNSKPETQQAQTKPTPRHTYTLKTQTEGFYVPRDTKNLKIIVRPLFQNTLERRIIKHRPQLTQLDIRWATTHTVGHCEVIEKKISDFTVIKAHKPLSYRELDLKVDGTSIKFSPEDNFIPFLDKSEFQVNLPDSRGDYFINLSTLNHKVPPNSIYEKDECDRIIYENSRTSLSMHLDSTPANQSLWTSYKVEVFYDL